MNTSEDVSRPTTYRPLPGVRWTVEGDGIILTNGLDLLRSIPHPKAAIWDLASRRYPFGKIVSLVSHIAGVELDDADRLVRATLLEWTAAGFLEAE